MTRRSRADAGPRSGILAAAAAVLLLSALPHVPLLDAGYVQDDHLAIETNPIVARADPVEIFTTSYWEGAKGNDRSLYRPIPVLSFALERRLSGSPSPRLSHAVNGFLHAGVSLSLLALSRGLGLGVPGAAAAALLFSAHPVHTEAVGNVVGRSEILAALFVLGALLAHGRSGPSSSLGSAPGEIPRSAGRARLASWTAAAFVFLALASKETALAVVPLLLLQAILFHPPGACRGKREAVARLASFAPVALSLGLYLVLRTLTLEALFVLQEVPPIDNPVAGTTGAARAATALAIAARYAWLLVAGHPLAADYSGRVLPPEPSLLAPLPISGLLFLLLLGALALFPLLPFPARRSFSPQRAWLLRRASFAAWLFLLPYLIVGNLFFAIGAGLAERLVYLPSAGICLLAGVFLDRALEPGPASRHGARAAKRIAAAALLLLLAAFATLTWRRSEEWKSDRTLFEAAARVNPESPRAHYILATLDERAGNAAAALARIETVLSVCPSHQPAWLQKAALLGKAGDFAGAAEAATEAVRLDPAYPLAHFNRGVALHRLHREAEAERSLRKAVLLDPRHPSAWAELGHVRFDLGNFAGAAEAYARAVALGRSSLAERLRQARDLAADPSPRSATDL